MKEQPLSEKHGRGKRATMNHILVLNLLPRSGIYHFTILLARASDRAKPDVHMVRYQPFT